jgi:hypothetical protein
MTRPRTSARHANTRPDRARLRLEALEAHELPASTL